eukprot:TRINITY_DN49302_c0_g1_i1.p1 TRINITY_DN49302_c0_g1~~TRINITY_DN49302_c0_g1_i1.p1  ORF type:complete len:371 (+),score=83.11 TRINITY_DN49302_c0_g1_i1:91-1203(+)
MGKVCSSLSGRSDTYDGYPPGMHVPPGYYGQHAGRPPVPGYPYAPSPGQYGPYGGQAGPWPPGSMPPMQPPGSMGLGAGGMGMPAMSSGSSAAWQAGGPGSVHMQMPMYGGAAPIMMSMPPPPPPPGRGSVTMNFSAPHAAPPAHWHPSASSGPRSSTGGNYYVTHHETIVSHDKPPEEAVQEAMQRLGMAISGAANQGHPGMQGFMANLNAQGTGVQMMHHSSTGVGPTSSVPMAQSGSTGIGPMGGFTPGGGQPPTAPMGRAYSMASCDAMHRLQAVATALGRLEAAATSVEQRLQASVLDAVSARTQLAQIEAEAKQLEADGVDSVTSGELETGKADIKALKRSLLERLEALFNKLETLFARLRAAG